MRLLDLFCGAGGAAMGYYRAGFAEIVGVDIKPQPRYPFTFIQGDALEYCAAHGKEFDAIHASPPCQHASRIARMNRVLRPNKYVHPDLIEKTRDELRATGRPYVIENVELATLQNPISLCGSWFGLPLRRHRDFETSFPVFGTPCSHGWQTPQFLALHRLRERRMVGFVGVHGHINYAGEKELRERAMGIDWMTPHELTQAIPPAYTEYIGRHLLNHIFCSLDHQEAFQKTGGKAKVSGAAARAARLSAKAKPAKKGKR